MLANSLVAAVCGTWKAKEIKGFWGDDYAATYLPKLECYDGDYQFKNFCGFKLMGVNPLSTFAAKDDAHLSLGPQSRSVHVRQRIAVAPLQFDRRWPEQFGSAPRMTRLRATSLLKALNAQYDYVCNYPATTQVVDKPLALQHGGQSDR
jgi:hypothetical protein